VIVAGRSRSSQDEPSQDEQQWCAKQRPKATWHVKEHDVEVVRWLRLVPAGEGDAPRDKGNQYHRDPEHAQTQHAAQPPVS
jgi:hypothetical protein